MIPTFLTSLSSKLWGYIAAVIGVVALIFGARAKWKGDGRQEVKDERARENLKNVEESNEIKRRVDSMPDGAALDELRDKWSR